MTTHILRRVLVAPVTLIGVTLLVFLLIALSPGGLSAAGRTGLLEGGAAASASAYVDDRYGLDDPALVQYGRWLTLVCPVKFGDPPLRGPAGNQVRLPRTARPPPFWHWFAPALPAVVAEWTGPDAGAPVEDRVGAYRAAAAVHADARVAYVRARIHLEAALIAAAAQAGIEGVIDDDGRLREAPLARLGDSPPPSLDLARVLPAGRAAVAAYARALETHAALAGALRARPYPVAGVEIIPGVISLAPPDLGVSVAAGRPVADMIGEALPITLLLNLIAFPIVYAIAIPGGLLTAARRGTWLDSTIGLALTALWSVPIVWAAVMAIGLFAAGTRLDWFPVAGLHDRAAETMAFLPGWTAQGFERGYLLDTLWHLALPVACLTYAGFAVLARQTRAATIESLGADYVRTARAKGVPELAVLLRHAFSNSLLPLITMAVAVFPAMLSGSVVVERVFSIPGMGNLILEAISQRDREVLMANTLIVAAVNIGALLLADLLYAAADPRIRVGART